MGLTIDTRLIPAHLKPAWNNDASRFELQRGDGVIYIVFIDKYSLLLI